MYCGVLVACEMFSPVSIECVTWDCYPTGPVWCQMSSNLLGSISVSCSTWVQAALLLCFWCQMKSFWLVSSPLLLLLGTLSDDPHFPKAPWPGPTLCASCHEEKNGVHVWNRNNVLVFLRHHYGASNLSPKYSIRPPELPAPPPDPAQFHSPQTEQQGDNKELNVKSKEQPESQVRHQILKQDASGPGGAAWVLGVGFNSIDMSLCVVLYVGSCLILMLLFFFFKVKSKRWKHRQSHLQVWPQLNWTRLFSTGANCQFSNCWGGLESRLLLAHDQGFSPLCLVQVLSDQLRFGPGLNLVLKQVLWILVCDVLKSNPVAHKCVCVCAINWLI